MFVITYRVDFIWPESIKLNPLRLYVTKLLPLLISFIFMCIIAGQGLHWNIVKYS